MIFILVRARQAVNTINETHCVVLMEPAKFNSSIESSYFVYTHGARSVASAAAAESATLARAV